MALLLTPLRCCFCLHGPSYRLLLFGPGLDIGSKSWQSEFFMGIFQARIGKRQSALSGAEAPMSETQVDVHDMLLPCGGGRREWSLLAERQRWEMEKRASPMCTPYLLSQCLTLPLEASLSIPFLPKLIWGGFLYLSTRNSNQFKSLPKQSRHQPHFPL